MEQVEISALQADTTAVIERVLTGDAVMVTDNGRALVTISPATCSPLEQLLRAGRIRPPKTAMWDPPSPIPGPSVSAALSSMRDDERY